MVTKEQLIEAARRGNFANTRNGSEAVCQSCNRYDWECEHDEDCPVGALLSLIENAELE